MHKILLNFLPKGKYLSNCFKFKILTFETLCLCACAWKILCPKWRQSRTYPTILNGCASLATNQRVTLMSMHELISNEIPLSEPVYYYIPNDQASRFFTSHTGIFGKTLHHTSLSASPPLIQIWFSATSFPVETSWTRLRQT